MGQQATLYRMVMDKHLCPSGLKAKALLEREGFTIDDHFVVGYGLDYAEDYRNLKEVCVLE